MKVLLINGSPRKGGNTYLALKEAALDAEGMQTMRSLAKNMAYLLKATENKPKPEYEARQAMHFIR